MTAAVSPGLRIAVVGPVTGGSLPVAVATAQAFAQLGHAVTFINNSHHGTALGKLKSAQIDADQRRTQEVDLFLHAAAETQSRVAAAQPQLAIYLAQAPVLSASNLAPLQEHNVPSVFWFVEDFRVFTYWQRAASRYDHVWTIQGEPFTSLLKQQGIKHVDFVPLACQPPQGGPPLGFAAGEVTFVGSGYPNRVQFFASLANPDLRLFGPGFAQNAALCHLVQADGVVPHEELEGIFAQSRINLNLGSTVDPACFGTPKDFVNPRAFEICAAGGFQMVESLLPIKDFFDPDNEVVTFLSAEEANDKIRFYQTHEAARQAIAVKGQARALAHHTYEARLSAALQRLLQVDGDRVQSARW